MSKPKLKKSKRKKTWLSPSWEACLPLTTMILLVWVYAAVAQNYHSPPPAVSQADFDILKNQVKDLNVGLDTMWVIFTACLVFFMNAGFAMVETGFCRHKNAVSVLSQNFIVFAVATLAFWATGFAIMFSNGGLVNDVFGTQGWFLSGLDNSPLTPSTEPVYKGVYGSLSTHGIPLAAKFFFHLVFADTAATIFTGAVAERIKFLAFFIFSFVLVGFLYPITGHWIWGGGWLFNKCFDFAGSTVVHSVGGWAGLVGALVLGPRIGRYGVFLSQQTNIRHDAITETTTEPEVIGFLSSRRTYIRRDDIGKQNPETNGPIESNLIEEKNVQVKPILVRSHNFSIATLGCLILWLGWFGFNPGSTLKADPNLITHIILTTNTAAAAAGVSATITSKLRLGNFNLSMILNGVLAGLVSITASCGYVSVPSAFIIGLIAGIIVVFAVLLIDNLRIDDPVGAISVHLVNGIWGTLAVGLFSVGPGTKLRDLALYTEGDGPAKGLFLGGDFTQLGYQLLGILAVGTFTALSSWLVWSAIKATIGMRVRLEDELDGLDISEHGLLAYGGFEVQQDAPEKAIRSQLSNQKSHPNNN